MILQKLAVRNSNIQFDVGCTVFFDAEGISTSDVPDAIAQVAIAQLGFVQVPHADTAQTVAAPKGDSDATDKPADPPPGPAEPDKSPAAPKPDVRLPLNRRKGRA